MCVCVRITLNILITNLAAILFLKFLLRSGLIPQNEESDVRCGCDALVWNLLPVWCFHSPTQTHWRSLVIFHDFSLLLVHIFTVSVLIFDPMLINCTMTIWQIRPQQLCTACISFRRPLKFGLSCEHLVWCGIAGQPNTSMSSKAVLDSSQSCLSSQRLRWNHRIVRVIKEGLGYWAHVHCHFKAQQNL